MQLACINVPTPDTVRFAEFYRTVLGAKIIDCHGGPERIEVCFGDSPENRGVLIVATLDKEYTKPRTIACQGFEFYVDNADVEYERIKAMGIVIENPPQDLPWGYRFFHINDPDGNGIDIVQKL